VILLVLNFLVSNSRSDLEWLVIGNRLKLGENTETVELSRQKQCKANMETCLCKKF